MVEYLFDENLSPSFARALNEIEKSRGQYAVLPTKDILGTGVSDAAIVQYAVSQQHQCVICTNDRDFKKRQLLPLIMSSSNVGLFVFQYPKGRNYWVEFSFLMKKWINLRNIVNTDSPPFAYWVSARKIFKI
jgi:hypothetical protein